MESITAHTILAFFSSLAFLWARTFNVHSTAELRMQAVLNSGLLIHFIWLVSISIGSNGAYKVLVDGDMQYIPVLIGSAIGSYIGNYIGLKKRIAWKENKNRMLAESTFIAPPAPPKKQEDGYTYIMGIDIGRYGDFNAVSVCRHRDGVMEIMDHAVSKEAGTFQHHIDRLWDKYGSMPTSVSHPKNI